MQATAKIDCNLQITVIDAATNTVICEQKRKNLVVNAGLNLVRDFLDGDSPNPPSHFAYGTGTTATTAGDTALAAEVSRDIFSGQASNAQQQVFSYYLSSVSGNGNTLGEVAIFNAASGGDMFARATLSPTIVKTSSIAVTFTWTINLGAS